MDSLVTVIQTVGFPIFVAVYLLDRYEKKLELLYQEHKQTNVVLAVLCKVLVDGNNGVPEEIFEEVSGVVDTPLPPSKKGDS